MCWFMKSNQYSFDSYLLLKLFFNNWFSSKIEKIKGVRKKSHFLFHKHYQNIFFSIAFFYFNLRLDVVWFWFQVAFHHTISIVFAQYIYCYCVIFFNGQIKRLYNKSTVTSLSILTKNRNVNKNNTVSFFLFFHDGFAPFLNWKKTPY